MQHESVITPLPALAMLLGLHRLCTLRGARVCGLNKCSCTQDMIDHVPAGAKAPSVWDHIVKAENLQRLSFSTLDKDGATTSPPLLIAAEISGTLLRVLSPG